MMKPKRLKTATALLLGAGLMVGLNAQDFVQNAKITLETREANDQLGTAVCFEDNQLFIGSTGQKEDENGQNPLEKAGAIFVYEKQADNLAQIQILVASDREAGGQFGNDVDVSGNYLVTGASNHAKDQAGNNELTKAGAVYVFKKNNDGGWDEVQKLVASDRAQNDLFGGSVAIEGDYLAVGAPGKDNSQGAVYVFEKNSSNVWEETTILASMKSFYPTYGRDVDISGNRLIVGSPSQVYSTTDPVYHYNFAGMAFIYERDDEGVWQEVYSASSSDVMEKDHFATSVAISGDYALVGTPDKQTDKDGQNTLAAAGAVYVLHRQSNGSWSEVQKITPDDRAKNDQFGSSVSLSGDMGVIGSWWDDQDADNNNTIKNSGSAYIIEKDEDGAWHIVQKIVADDRSEEAGFGSNVFIENQTIFSGVGFEDYNSEGTDSIKNAGAVYMFEPTGPASTIGKEKTTKDFVVYPNPVTNVLSVDLSGIISPNGMINIMNLDGKVIKIREVTGTGIISLDVSHLPKGIYLCRFINSKETKTLKFIKQ